MIHLCQGCIGSRVSSVTMPPSLLTFLCGLFIPCVEGVYSGLCFLRMNSLCLGVASMCMWEVGSGSLYAAILDLPPPIFNL